MKQVWTFSDDRLDVWCFFCSSSYGITRDHVPPKALLDTPYPENLPVVASCASCNASASVDEQYVAALLEVAVCGTTDPAGLERAKIRRTIERSPALASRLEQSFSATDEETISITPEFDRVHRVLEKMARGIWRFETSEPTGLMSAEVLCQPVEMVEPDELDAFMTLEPPQILPEVGSRMMQRVLLADRSGIANEWQHVQPGRFSYGVQAGGTVRMVLRDYLLAEVSLLACVAPPGVRPGLGR